MKFLKNKIIIATHYFVYGAPQALREYLIKHKIQRLLFIAHPLYSDSNRSYCELIENGKIVNKKEFSLRFKVPIFNYLIELLSSLIWTIKSDTYNDLFIGIDNLNALVGLILRHTGKVKKVVYYTIDYSPQRFQNKILNFLYHRIDCICVRYADVVWNVSPRISEGRKKIEGLNYLYKQKIVPIGVWSEKVKRLPFDKIKKHQLLFVGHLLGKQGVQLVIDAIPSIIKKIPDFHFLIIGGGDFEKNLKEKVDNLGLNQYVTFTGWIKDRDKLDKILSESACAIAPYNPSKSEYSYYADPTKIKDYLSAGLPVIMTEVPYNAKELEKEKCGIIIDYKSKSIVEAVIKLMTDELKLKLFSDNALEYIKRYDWNHIFDKAFREL